MLAAACTGGGATRTSPPPPPDTPSASASSSPSPSPSRTGPLSTGPNVRPGEKPPVLPEAAKEHSPAGALAFATYFIKALDWGFATNDAYLVEKISSASCQACKRNISALDKLNHDHGIERGARVHLVSGRLVTGDFRYKSELVAEIQLRQDRAVISRPSSAPTTIQPENPYTSLVFVSWQSGHWIIVEFGAPSK